MSTIESAGTLSGAGAGFLDRERTIATAGFNRWLVPPAALCIHLCIGMAYGFSVFWLPLSRAIGVTAPKACAEMSLFQELFTTSCDWKVASMGWMYTLFFVLLGIAAAVWGGWLERVGPRKAGFVSALCWCGGLFLGAIGVYTHQLWLLWLGSGVIGGIGLGLGYISPVSTLVKWFPDRRGMATGMAIMGFGGGAMIGAPLANLLMNYFKTPTSVGVWETFVAMGVIYFVFMMIGAFRYRLPPPGWQPEGWTAPSKANAMISKANVHLNDAHKTPQFWLIWWVLCLNVSAGIGVIGMASPMLQEIFAGKLIGLPEVGFNALDAGQKAQIAAIAAGFAGLLSLFNIGGRFFWASLSDKIGRKNTYYTFFILGIVLYALAPTFAAMGSKLLFVLGFGIILSMYGGGFRHRAGLPRRHVRNPVRGRHPWPATDGVVHRGHHRPRRGQLHPRVPARGRRAARSALQHDHVHPLCDADRGFDLQLSDQAGRFEMAHEGGRCRQVAGCKRQRRRRGAARLLRHRIWRT
ncbi:MFS family permease [Bradyrhizobium sp. F1.13.4]